MLCQAFSMASDGDEIFTPDDAFSEIVRQYGEAKVIDWKPTVNQTISLTIPPTVYPPREDTSLMAARIIKLGAGKKRKFLEVGCGSGALTILAASLGWNVFACDINPFAVAATKGNLEKNMQTGVVKEGGVGPDGFPFEEKFDLIIWNLPYIPLNEVSEVLGPMEEAGLIDTDKLGLHNRLISLISDNDLLASKGIMLLLGRSGCIKPTGDFAVRAWDNMTFDDGEMLTIFCLWKPYELSEKLFVERTGSTNDDLFEKSGIGTHVYTPLQTNGRGRRNRDWISIERCYAGSWIVAENSEVNPGLLQLSGGLAVLRTLNHNRLNLKWPNDILIHDRKLCGILVEGKTSQDLTKVVLGIGINIGPSKQIVDGKRIASLSEIGDFDFHQLDNRLNSELSSLIEHREDIPPVNFESIRKEALTRMKSFGKPKYQGIVFDDFQLNQRGELVLGDTTIDDGENIDWI